VEEIEFSLLGSLRVIGQGGEIVINGPVRRRLLARLLIAANRPVPAGRLREDLWDGQLPASASTLKSHVSLLRHSLGRERLSSRDGGYQLTVGPGELDIALFENDLAAGRAFLRAGNPAAAAESLGRALSRWRGPALADVAELRWGRPDAVRLEELRAAALEGWLEARLAIGEGGEVIAEAEAAVGQYPLREQLWARLITALYFAGRQADALAAYRRLRDLLAEELGISPNQELINLEKAILRQELEPPHAPEALWLATARRESSGLPADATSFVPRPRELADLARLLRVPGLVTLTGPGGTGKTRLAIQAAREAAAQFSEVWLCELAPVDNPDHLVQEVAAAVGCVGQPDDDLHVAIADRLDDEPSLLILDNCEHLLDAAAALSRRLLDGSPLLHLLVTSRSPLDLPGEVVYTVPPMSVPGDVSDPDEALTFESVRLFVDRARNLQLSFTLDSVNCRAVCAVCARLDGLPLAVELAAARMRSMSVPDLERRLDEGFRLLTAGSRAGPARHRTLKTLIDWSYNLLSVRERGALGRLAVFVGGFDLSAAEAVTGGDGDLPALDVVFSLADKSLLQVDVAGYAARYRILETVREYALATLTEQEQAAARMAHARHFLDVIESVAPLFWGPGQRAWRERLEPDEENLRGAFITLLTLGSAEEALRFGAAISTYWNSRGIYGDDIGLLESALERRGAGDPTAARGAALAAAGYLHFRSGEAGRAQARLDEAAGIAHARDLPALTADVLRTKAWVAERQGDHDRAAALASDALAAALTSGTTHLIARSFDVRAAATQESDPQGARADYGLALRYCRAAGDALGQASVLNNLAVLELEQGDPLTARACFTQALTLADEIRDAALVPFLEYGFGLAAALDGDHAAAEPAFISAIGQARRTSQRSLLAYALLGVAVARGSTGHDHDAATLLGASAALFDQAGEQPERLEAALRDRIGAHVRGRLGERYDAVQAAGRRLAVHEAIRLATERGGAHLSTL
jgi:predicted ATPase/DNA-binding SARP family transcriptional activator